MTQAAVVPTTERLARALEQWKAPEHMVKAARAGRYDDYLSEAPTPIVDLVRDLHRIGAHALAQRAIDGEFDATREEADAWFQREGSKLIPGGA